MRIFARSILTPDKWMQFQSGPQQCPCLNLFLREPPPVFLNRRTPKLLHHFNRHLKNFVRHLDTHFSISNLKQLVLGCIDADLRDQILVGMMDLH